jgi:hypothetical protein
MTFSVLPENGIAELKDMLRRGITNNCHHCDKAGRGSLSVPVGTPLQVGGGARYGAGLIV